MEIVPTAIFFCPYFKQCYFYEESTEVTTIKKKTFGLYFSKLNSFLLSFFSTVEHLLNNTILMTK